MSALLEVTLVSVSFDGFKAINNLSFDHRPAELRAVIGPNGAGKTTFMDIVTGKTRPDEGGCAGANGPFAPAQAVRSQIAREGIGRKFQRPTVFEDQSVRDNLRVALKNDRGPFAVLFATGPSPEDRAGSRSAPRRSAFPATRPQGGRSSATGRSSGWRSACCWRRTRACCWSTSRRPGMTTGNATTPTDLLKRLAETRAVVVVEHDMEFVRRLDCKVTVLHEGSVLAEGSLDHVMANERVIEVYLGR
jgi:urea transport system ATP-binding protein